MAKEAAAPEKDQPSVDRKAIAAYVQDLLQTRLPGGMSFHNWAHTELVYEAVRELAKAHNLSKQERHWLEIAALFHDTGFIIKYDGHEDESKAIARRYLEGVQYPEAEIQRIERLIDVTKSNVEPTDLLERIMMDADMAHLGRKKYRNRLDRLRKERNLLLGESNKRRDWETANLDFLKGHTYQTQGGAALYGERKQKNFDKAVDRLRKIKKDEQKIKAPNSIEGSKSAQVIFKTALRNHIDLTSIADQKANIMISICSLILAVGMPAAAKFIDGSVRLLIPSLLFLLTCIITMVYATLSTRPIKTTGKTNLDSIQSGRTNLFFFGNFYKLSQDEYHAAIDKLMQNSENLEDSIVNDLYWLGKALGNKFRFLRICYTIFVVGIIITFIAFLITYFSYYGMGH